MQPPCPILHWPAHHLQRIDARQGLRVTVLQGRLWLTRTGLLQDLFLQTGQSLDLQGRGWVLEAEQDSQLRLVPMAPAGRRSLGWPMRRTDHTG